MNFKYMKMILAILIIFLNLNYLLAKQNIDHGNKIFLNKAWDLYKDKKYDQIIEITTKYLGSYPDDLEAYYLRGISFYNLNKFKESINDFSKIISTNPLYYENLYSWRGAAYYRLKIWDRAISDLSKDLLNNPNDTNILYRRARSYSELGKYKMAISDYSRILKSNADDRQIYLYRSQAYFKNSEYQHGFNDLFKGSNIYYLTLVICLMYLGAFLLSFLVMLIIFRRKKYNENEKYALYNRYNSLTGLPLLFGAIYILQEFQLWKLTFNLASVFLGGKDVFIVLLLIFLVSLILFGFKICHSTIISYYLQKRVRKVEISFFRYLKISSLIFIYFFLVQLGFFTYMLFVENLNVQGWPGQLISFGLICILLYLVMNTYTWFISFFWGRLKDIEKEVNFLYSDFVNKFNIKLKSLRVLKTSDCKMANAWVTGIRKNQIFVTDYLINNFTIKEVKGVLAHEIGHVKKKHIYYRFAIIIFLLISSHYIGVYFENFYWAELIYILISITFIFTILFRYQENEADLYAIENTDDPYAYLSALEKLVHLNTSTLKVRKFEEKMHTHPSIDKRIARLKKILESKQ